MKLGACHVETPFIELGQLSTALYFGHFIIIVPVISLIENTLVDLSFGWRVKTRSNRIISIVGINNNSPRISKRSFHSTRSRHAPFDTIHLSLQLLELIEVKDIVASTARALEVGDFTHPVITKLGEFFSSLTKDGTMTCGQSWGFDTNRLASGQIQSGPTLTAIRNLEVRMDANIQIVETLRDQ
jgi:hypothetical protein